MIVMLFNFALAEEELVRSAGFDALADYAERSGFDAWSALRALLNGEGVGLSEIAGQWLDALKGQAQGVFAELLRGVLPPVLLCTVLRLLLGRERASRGMAELLCTLCCSVTLVERTVTARATVAAFLETVNRASDALTPVLVSAAALTGATATASIMTPLAAECANVINLMLRDAGLKLCMAACAVAVAGSLSPKFPLRRLFGLMKSAVRWLLAGSMFAFGALMSARGLIGAARDTAAIQAARLAIENLVPVIGGEVSGSAGSLAASASVARRALGVTGVAFIIHICAEPILKLAAGMVSMKLIAAMLEPLAGDAAAVALVGRFGEVMELLLALCACAAVMTALLVGGCAVLMGV